MLNFFRNFSRIEVKLKFFWNNTYEEEEKSFYEKECINSNWGVRELKRQLKTLLFERVLLSGCKSNKETVYKLSKEGQMLKILEDI